MIGADLRGAILRQTSLEGADLTWAQMSDCRLEDCDTNEARMPIEAKVTYRPKGVLAPEIQAKPMYRISLEEVSSANAEREIQRTPANSGVDRPD